VPGGREASSATEASAAASAVGVSTGLFSLLASCDEGWLAGSIRGDEGSGDSNLVSGCAPDRIGGGKIGMGKSLCAIYVEMWQVSGRN
jgi:hypothetical protein